MAKSTVLPLTVSSSTAAVSETTRTVGLENVKLRAPECAVKFTEPAYAAEPVGEDPMVFEDPVNVVVVPLSDAGEVAATVPWPIGPVTYDLKDASTAQVRFPRLGAAIAVVARVPKPVTSKVISAAPKAIAFAAGVRRDTGAPIARGHARLAVARFLTEHNPRQTKNAKRGLRNSTPLSGPYSTPLTAKQTAKERGR